MEPLHAGVNAGESMKITAWSASCHTANLPWLETVLLATSKVIPQSVRLFTNGLRSKKHVQRHRASEEDGKHHAYKRYLHDCYPDPVCERPEHTNLTDQRHWKQNVEMCFCAWCAVGIWSVECARSMPQSSNVLSQWQEREKEQSNQRTTTENLKPLIHIPFHSDLAEMSGKRREHAYGEVQLTRQWAA